MSNVNEEMAKICQRSETNAMATKLIIAISDKMKNEAQKDLVKHQLIGHCFGGNKWLKEIPSTVIDHLKFLLENSEYLNQQPDLYRKALVSGQNVPLWYVMHHFITTYGSIGTDFDGDNTLPVIEIIRKYTHSTQGQSRPVMGYINDPLQSVTPEQIVAIHQELVNLKHSQRGFQDPEELKRRAVSGDRVTRASQVSEALQAILEADQEPGPDHLVLEQIEKMLEDFYRSKDSLSLSIQKSDGAIHILKITPAGIVKKDC